jgi:hypothetical protein
MASWQQLLDHKRIHDCCVKHMYVYTARFDGSCLCMVG